MVQQENVFEKKFETKNDAKNIFMLMILMLQWISRAAANPPQLFSVVA